MKLQAMISMQAMDITDLDGEVISFEGVREITAHDEQHVNWREVEAVLMQEFAYDQQEWNVVDAYSCGEGRFMYVLRHRTVPLAWGSCIVREVTE
jgi:hypothetical protein